MLVIHSIYFICCLLHALVVVQCHNYNYIQDLNNNQYVTSFSGHRIPLSSINAHINPTASTPATITSVQALIYEHVGSSNELIASDGKRLSIRSLVHSSHERTSFQSIVNDGPIRDVPSGEVLYGASHTFVYDEYGEVLLAAWGPNLTLIPIQHDHHSNQPVYLNIHSRLHAHHIHSPHSQHTLRQEQQPSTPPPRTHVFTSELSLFFDAAFAHDSSFCAIYNNNGPEAQQVIHAAAVEAHRMAFSTIVSVRISYVTGYCKSAQSNDPFRLPRNLCDPKSTSCDLSDNPPNILRMFSASWRGTQQETSDVDVAYLITNYPERVLSRVVGAAYVGAACNRQYGYGWMNRVHPTVIAHEMAHSLGAPHDASDGLMRSQLNLDVTDMSLSERSKRHIQGYVDTGLQTCLSTRHSYSPRGNVRFNSFIRISRDQFSEGSDVAFYGKHGSFFIVNVYKQNPARQQLFVHQGVVKRQNVVRHVFPFTLNFNRNGVVVFGSYADHKAGAGIAVAAPSLGGWFKVDVAVVFMHNASHAVYKIGFGFDEKHTTFTRGWSKRFFLPFNLRLSSSSSDSAVECIGATFRRHNSNAYDLVVTYAIKTPAGQYEMYYVIGRGMTANGLIYSDAWQEPVRLFATWDQVGDVSPVFIDANNRFVVSYTCKQQQKKAPWMQNFLVGTFSPLTGLWAFIMRKGDLAYTPDSSTQKLSGGLAIVDFNDQRGIETGILYHSRQFASGNTQWVEVGDDMLARFPVRKRQVAVADMVTPYDMCAICYANGADEMQCRKQFKTCFANRSSFALSQVSMKQLQKRERQRQLKLESNSIFCHGFHAMYIQPSNMCALEKPINTNDIWSVGVERAIEGDLSMNGLQIQHNTSFGRVSETEWFVNFGGLAGSTRLPMTAVFHVYSPKFVRWIIINRALNKLRKRSDFTSVFKTPDTGFVTRVGRNYFKVTLRFRLKFHTEFFKTLRNGRLA